MIVINPLAKARGFTRTTKSLLHLSIRPFVYRAEKSTMFSHCHFVCLWVPGKYQGPPCEKRLPALGDFLQQKDLCREKMAQQFFANSPRVVRPFFSFIFYLWLRSFEEG